MYIGITTRTHKLYADEIFDSLSQNWSTFFDSFSDVIQIILPNSPMYVNKIFGAINFGGFVLSGGESLVEYGGSSRLRDEVERVVLNYAIKNKIPVIGVCRGMQHLNCFFGGSLKQIDNHININHPVYNPKGEQRIVNSYHALAIDKLGKDLLPIWIDEHDNCEGFIHKDLPIIGIMWHPERYIEQKEEDLILFKKHFNIKK